MENKLDGNAAAGALQAIFPFEMTLVQATCTGCGATNAHRCVRRLHAWDGDGHPLPLLRYRAHPRCAKERTLLAGYAGRARPSDQQRGNEHGMKTHLEIFRCMDAFLSKRRATMATLHSRQMMVEDLTDLLAGGRGTPDANARLAARFSFGETLCP